MLTFNKSNIDLLGPLICDADFNLSVLPKTTDKGVVTFKIRRPFWENQEKIKKFFIKQTVVKEIFSELTIDKVTDIKYNWKDDIYNNPDDRHSIRNISADQENKNIKLETDYLIVIFSIEPNFKIQLNDTTKTDKGTFLKIFGWEGMDYHAWKEEYKQKKIV
jgi:hypothetical protein